MKKAACSLLLLASLLSLSTRTVHAGPYSTLHSTPKIMVVVLENTPFDLALKQPFLGTMARQGALLVNSYGVTHPSQPNYIALTAGDTLGVLTDSPVDLKATHLGDLLETHGKSWRVYAEGFPGGCFLGKKSGKYVRKHVPFLSYVNVQANAQRCARVTDSSMMMRDIATGNIADFSFVAPDMDDDGHDTDVSYADHWLDQTFGTLLRAGKFPADLILAVTFDEDNYFNGNHIYTALLGRAVKSGSIARENYNHYNLLRTFEEILGIGTLGREDQKAVPIKGIWNTRR